MHPCVSQGVNPWLARPRVQCRNTGAAGHTNGGGLAGSAPMVTGPPLHRCRREPTQPINAGPGSTPAEPDLVKSDPRHAFHMLQPDVGRASKCAFNRRDIRVTHTVLLENAFPGADRADDLQNHRGRVSRSKPELPCPCRMGTWPHTDVRPSAPPPSAAGTASSWPGRCMKTIRWVTSEIQVGRLGATGALAAFVLQQRLRGGIGDCNDVLQQAQLLHHQQNGSQSRLYASLFNPQYRGGAAFGTHRQFWLRDVASYPRITDQRPQMRCSAGRLGGGEAA